MHPARRYTSSGVISGAASVEAMVIPTERATVTTGNISDDITCSSTRAAANQNHSQCKISRKVKCRCEKPGNDRHKCILSNKTKDHFFRSGKDNFKISQS